MWKRYHHNGNKSIKINKSAYFGSSDLEHDGIIDRFSKQNQAYSSIKMKDSARSNSFTKERLNHT